MYAAAASLPPLHPPVVITLYRERYQWSWGCLLDILVVLFVLLIFFLCFATARVHTVPDVPNTQVPWTDPLIHPWKLGPRIETGDLLAVSYRHLIGWFVSTWFHTLWSHVGVAWRDPRTDELFVLEAAYYNHSPYKGVFKIPVQEWVRYNKRQRLGWSRLLWTGNGASPLDPKRILEKFETLRALELERFNWTWVRLLKRRKYDHQEFEDFQQRHYTCYEIATRLLQMSGVVQRTWRPQSYTPGDLMGGSGGAACPGPGVRGRLHLEPGWRYLPAVELTGAPEWWEEGEAKQRGFGGTMRNPNPGKEDRGGPAQPAPHVLLPPPSRRGVLPQDPPAPPLERPGGNPAPEDHLFCPVGGLPPRGDI